MPILKTQQSRPYLKIARGGHLETIAPYLFRTVRNVEYTRSRVTTIDGDFLDLDWLIQEKSPTDFPSQLIILSHGLEGSGQSSYMKGMAKVFHQAGFDILAWNMRSCSGELNKRERFYHAGDLEDFEFVLNCAQAQKNYEAIHLIGFSLGANLTAKYLGTKKNDILPKIKTSVLISNPVDLEVSDLELHKRTNRIYMETFLKTMKQKVWEKSQLMNLPMVDISMLNKCYTLRDFNDYFVAPLHGFKNIIEYYEYASCKDDLINIQIPTLMISAKNDPFLGKNCYPIRSAAKNKNLFLELTRTGGHLGFEIKVNKSKLYWSEIRALEFISENS